MCHYGPSHDLNSLLNHMEVTHDSLLKLSNQSKGGGKAGMKVKEGFEGDEEKEEAEKDKKGAEDLVE